MCHFCTTRNTTWNWKKIRIVFKRFSRMLLLSVIDWFNKYDVTSYTVIYLKGWLIPWRFGGGMRFLMCNSQVYCRNWASWWELNSVCHLVVWYVSAAGKQTCHLLVNFAVLNPNSSFVWLRRSDEFLKLMEGYQTETKLGPINFSYSGFYCAWFTLLKIK